MQKSKFKSQTYQWRFDENPTKDTKSYEFQSFNFVTSLGAALPYVVYCKFHKLPFSQNNMNYFTCAFDILSDTCFYTRLFEIDPFLHQETWKRGNLWKLQYTTYGRAARKWRHKIKTLKIHNFVILWWIFVKPSLICFSHSSAFIKTNLISGWTSPLTPHRFTTLEIRIKAKNKR